MPLIPEIKISIENKDVLVLDEFARTGIFLRNHTNQLLLYAGGFTAVFPFVKDGQKWAFRCWHTYLNDAPQRYRLIWDYLNDVSLPYFTQGAYVGKGIVVNGEVLPIIMMKWVDGITIKEYICLNANTPDKINSLADRFKKMCCDLHHKKISHGDLQHGNILVDDSGNLHLVDYDSMYVPAMANHFSDVITGLKDYQHPLRMSKAHVLSEKVDYFSELVIYLSLLAIAKKPDLINTYSLKDTEALLFTAEDFKNFQSSKVYRELYALGDEGIKFYLDILNKYLQERDLNKLEPFFEFKAIVPEKSSLPEISDFGYDQYKPSSLITLWWKVKNADKVKLKYRDKEYDVTDTPCVRFITQESRKVTFVLSNKDNYVLSEFQIPSKFIVSSIPLWAGKPTLLADVNNDNKQKRPIVKTGKSKVHETCTSQNEREEQAWKSALLSDTITSYVHYINTSILKAHIKEAEDRLDALLWSAAKNKDDVSSYRLYLDSTVIERHIKKHTEEAKDRIQELKASVEEIKEQTIKKSIWKSNFRLFLIILLSCIIAIIITIVGTFGNQSDKEVQNPKVTVSADEISKLEKEMEVLLDALEIPEVSYNSDMDRKAKDNLERLRQAGSKKYQTYLDRYNRCK